MSPLMLKRHDHYRCQLEDRAESLLSGRFSKYGYLSGASVPTDFAVQD
jgi:hypothetical protein